MIDKEDIDSINKGMPHCVLNRRYDLCCNKCGYEFPTSTHFPNGIEIWAMQGLAWGFAKQHADCEEEEE